jgi:hypothetical protein
MRCWAIRASTRVCLPPCRNWSDSLSARESSAGKRETRIGSWMMTTLERQRHGWADVWVLLTLTGLLFVFVPLTSVLSSTTPTGGDTAAHIYPPWFLREHLLPEWRLTGWSQDWFAGFPIYRFYFPLVAMLQAIVSYAIDYEIAFKIGMLLGTLLLPAAAYLFMKSVGFQYPVPAAASLGALMFLAMANNDVLGGNILSSVNGEYSFSLALSLFLIFLGLAYSSVSNQRSRIVAGSVALTLCGISHLLPVFIAVALAPYLFVLGSRRIGWHRAFVRLASMYLMAFCLGAFWFLPFLTQVSYAARLLPEDFLGVVHAFPDDLDIPIILATIGLAFAIKRHDGRVVLLALPGGVGLLFFLTHPLEAIWDARFLPFWYLTVLLVAAYGLGETLRTIEGRLPRYLIPAPVIVPALVLPLLGIGVAMQHPGVRREVSSVFAGYENSDGYSTFRLLTEVLRREAPGRVMWDWSEEIEASFGSPHALMSLPYWTNQQTIDGMFFESSLTSPFVYITKSELSAERVLVNTSIRPSHLDLDRAIQHMKMLGVRYFIARSENVKQAASRVDGLDLVAPAGQFLVFELASSLVEVPTNEPVVVDSGNWQEISLEWFRDPRLADVPIVSEGPQSWARSDSPTDLPREPLEAGGRSLPVSISQEEVRFETDAIGQPHVVKVSYFPSWEAKGARGPYLASPSMMIVVPTQREVSLRYARTTPEVLGTGLSFASVALVLVSGAAVPLRRRILRNRR